MNKILSKFLAPVILVSSISIAKAQETFTTVIKPSDNTDACPRGTETAAIEALDVWKKIECGYVDMTDFPILALTWLQLLFQISIGVAVIMLMVGGVQFMIGSTMEDKDSGKKTISMAILGLIVSGFAAVIVDLVLRTFS